MKIKLTDIPLEKSRSSHLEGKADKYGDFLASCFNPTKEARENRAPNATVSAQHFLLVHRHHALVEYLHTFYVMQVSKTLCSQRSTKLSTCLSCNGYDDNIIIQNYLLSHYYFIHKLDTSLTLGQLL